MKLTKQALKKLRQLSHEGVVFSIEYVSHNTTNKRSSGIKIINRCVLRNGYGEETSDKSSILVGYTDLETNKPGFFYAPLLLKINNQLICRMKL